MPRYALFTVLLLSGCATGDGDTCSRCPEWGQITVGVEDTDGQLGTTGADDSTSGSESGSDGVVGDSSGGAGSSSGGPAEAPGSTARTTAS